jgi:hypothetical protein
MPSASKIDQSLASQELGISYDFVHMDSRQAKQ